MEPHAGDSREQRDAEAIMLAIFGETIGTKLRKRRYPLPEGGFLEIDGVSENPPIVCEVFAHLGRTKGGQQKKIATDALKLLYATRFLPSDTRKVLLFADRAAAQHLMGKAWVGQVLRAEGIELHFVELPLATRDAVLNAQSRQFR